MLCTRIRRPFVDIWMPDHVRHDGMPWIAVQGRRRHSGPGPVKYEAEQDFTGQALLNTKQNKISQGRLIESGMTVCPGSGSRAGVVIPAQAGIQCDSGSMF